MHPRVGPHPILSAQPHGAKDELKEKKTLVGGVRGPSSGQGGVSVQVKEQSPREVGAMLGAADAERFSREGFVEVWAMCKGKVDGGGGRDKWGLCPFQPRWLCGCAGKQGDRLMSGTLCCSVQRALRR